MIEKKPIEQVLSELEAEYKQLANCIEFSLNEKESNIWQLCYHWWLVYKKLNMQLEEAKDLKEKDQIVTSFAKFQETLSKSTKATYNKVGIDQSQIKELDELMENYPPHMKDIIQVMRMQKRAFIENVKAIKAEKEGKGGTLVRKYNKIKRKWIKS